VGEPGDRSAGAVRPRSPPADAGGRYTGFQGGPRHLGRAHGGVDGNIEPVWSHSEPSEPPGHEFGTPAVADGTVYVPQGTINGEDATAYVTARDLETGEREWRFEHPGTNVVDGAVYADGTVVQQFSGVLVAIDAASGDELWRRSGGFDGTPVVADGRVFAASLDMEGATLYALDLASGDELWSTPVSPSGRGGIPTPAVADGVVYTAESTLTGRDVADGSVLSTWSTEKPPGSAPTVTDDIVYVGTEESGIAAVDLQAGVQRWWNDVATAGRGSGPKVPSSPAVADGTVVTTSLWAGTALDAESGERQWSEEVGANTPPVIGDDAVYFGGIDECRRYALTDGSFEDAFDTDDSNGANAPAVVEGAVLYPSDEIYALSDA